MGVFISCFFILYFETGTLNELGLFIDQNGRPAKPRYLLASVFFMLELQAWATEPSFDMDSGDQPTGPRAGTASTFSTEPHLHH